MWLLLVLEPQVEANCGEELHGFRKKHSCWTAIKKIQGDVKEGK